MNWNSPIPPEEHQKHYDVLTKIITERYPRIKGAHCASIAYGIIDYVYSLSEAAALAQPVPHSDDLAVDRFAAAMKAKMAASRAKGRGGWDDERQCPMAKLSNMLIAHARKGDPVDVANFAMMLHQREQMAIEHHPCNGGIATVSLRSAMDELLGTVDGENMDWKERATIMALEKIAQPSPSSVGAAIRALEVGTSGSKGYVKAFCHGAAVMRDAAAELAEQVQGQQVPEGWQLVPKEPTPEMIAAFAFRGDVEMAIGHAAIYEDACEDYAEMLAAAPSIAQDGQKSEGA